MSSHKKRKERTLLHFFSSTPARKPKESSHVSQDIIIIDDDDDDQVKPTKRKRNEVRVATDFVSLFGHPSSLLRPCTAPRGDSDILSEGWATGDDEINNQVSECPVCALQLLGLQLEEVQEHINKCLDLSSSSSNAFSVLMSSHKENAVWKEAAAAEDCKKSGGRRKAPFYKVLQGMPIAVDAFRYGTIPGVTAYFLTHAHSDHYTNLSAKWASGPIYCSEGTASLIIHMLSVDPKWVHPLPMDVPTVIPDTGGVSVTLIEANHCPGSCLFLYEGRQTVDAGDSEFKSSLVGSSKTFRYLHCGDFRASPQHVLHPAVKGKTVDHVYLDTTYLDPKYVFPPQPQVISACAELAKRQAVEDRWVGKQQNKRVLIVVGTYLIGKERIVKAIAHALKSKVYCDARKAAILRCQPDAELHALLTANPDDASVHLVPLGLLTLNKLRGYHERFKGTFSRVVGIRPTGWSYSPAAGSEQNPTIGSVIARSQQRTFTYANLRPARNSTGTMQLFGVPYSEHSSFFELTCFAMSFDWGKMIATVNVGSESSRGKMGKWIKKWETERQKRGKDSIIAYREADYW